FSEATALEDALKLRVDSPFDYRAHARVWVPSNLPKPNEARHPAAIGALAATLAARLGGRTFVLTTTLRVLEPIAQALRDAAERKGAALEVLVQGTQPRRQLLDRFVSGRGRVLVGSQSFWEGIDVPGEALQCVLIDKLPFPPPNDPLVRARADALRARGRDPFNDYFVAEAAVSLKQGAGRLIRHEDDRGLLVIGDVRMRQMGYGQRLLRALPPMAPLHHEADALAWLDQLAAAHAP
ncbi:MAG TPA: helicase C-terminal domain-containing protein, partial [Burkholderiaceae bacterium]|nr:helicase C-terminal domain-containing protein [Burkholderiaceae bacterium]